MRKSIFTLFVLLITVAFAGSAMAGPRRLKPDRETKGCVDLELRVAPAESTYRDEVVVTASVTNCGHRRDYITVAMAMEYDGESKDYGVFAKDMGSTSFKLGPGETRSVSIAFMVRDGMPAGTYSVFAKASSYHGGHAWAEAHMDLL